ncbi:hypothetical protein OCV67_03060 [Porcipelethomonas ammoniilytica]|uniref:hypothetical protein n=1 Tax=Porcipelethomonas ammoniilytica TaxID=2981722 RepID=UPI0008213C88|nr:hypothetical protein [Porcipelethomonas ammoniilytica]MCU6718914.1 hypothetical protein [Porcipelethomonas ammoniilytica]SCI65411.1 Uncharacterised protein [uncultured Ruminococcus sp.]
MMQVKFTFKKYKTKIIIIALTTILVGFILMQINTNSVIQEIYDAFYSTDCYVPASLSKYYNNQDIDDYNIIFVDDDKFNNNIKSHFNELHEYNNSNYTINLEVKRVYTIHDFKSGYLWIKYSVVVLDKTGNIMTSSKNIPVKLKIKKNKSNWEVIRIDEKEAYSNTKDFFDFWTI